MSNLTERIDKGKVFPTEVIAGQYESDEHHSDELFLNKKLTLCGEIMRIDNVVSQILIRLKGKGAKYSGIHFKIYPRDRDDIAKISNNDEVTIQGICRGLEHTTSPSGDEIGWIMMEKAKILNL